MPLDTIPDSTRAVIAASQFRLEPEPLVFAKVATVRHPERHRLVHRDEREITVVTTEDQLDDLDVLELNRDRWWLFTIDCANPFYCVGFIHAITGAMTAAGIDVLLLSTFSRDLVFVKHGEQQRARELLLAAGFGETVSEQWTQ